MAAAATPGCLAQELFNQIGSVWLQTAGNLVDTYTSGTLTAAFDPANPLSELSLDDGSTLSEPALNQLVKVMDLYSAVSGGVGIPTLAALQASPGGLQVLKAESIYWSPPPGTANQTVVINPDRRRSTGLPPTPTPCVFRALLAVNWPPAAPPAARRRPCRPA